MKNLSRISLLLFLLFSAPQLFAQTGEEIINKVEEALKSSSSKELSDHLNDRLEIKLDGEKKEYSAAQAQVKLKQFFQNNPSEEFKFIHQGSSPGGIIYAIGDYATRRLNYRVVVRVKKFKDGFKVYRLEFNNQR